MIIGALLGAILGALIGIGQTLHRIEKRLAASPAGLDAEGREG